MNRSTLDKLISSTGLVLAVLLLAAAGGMYYAYTFVHGQVTSQLSDQKIMFPAAGSASITSLPAEDQPAIAKYAGQQLTTGAQAEAYADHYIAVHIAKIAGGKTYAELSSAAQAAPTDTKLAGQVQTVFRGETLRGMLLNAYAFDTMAIVALYASYVAVAGAILLFILSGLGFYHSTYVKSSKKR